ncbi:helix-turn-helix domain-containing protein [Geodermatophilus sp. SYSU D01119]
MPAKLVASVAAVVRQLCEERGWSARELARRTGMKPTAATYKLSGDRAWDVGDLEAIATAADLRVSDLIARAELAAG